jgi:hypothetical protein
MRSITVRRAILLAVVFFIAALLMPLPTRAQPPAADPSPLPGVHFIHVATADNIASNWTDIDHPLLNGNDAAIVFVTQNWNPRNLSGTYNANAVGVWYHGAEQKWAIFNQDNSAMPDGAAFNVHIPVVDSTRFVHDATISNSTGHLTYIMHPLLNSNPTATLFVTQNWNPSGEPGVYNDHAVGVSFNDYRQQWYIFNQDFGQMPEGASFNVLVSSADETTIIHLATLGTISGHVSTIDDSRINDNPNALLTIAQNWSPHSVYNAHPFGVYYFGGFWRIFNQDFVTMPQNAAFNILVPPTDSVAFVHVATAANSASQVTYIDHPLLNGNPDAIALATQNWNPGGSGSTYNDHHIGIWYSQTQDKWSVFNQDVADMPEGAAFNIYVPPIGANAFTHVATPDNVDGNVTYIGHPESNGDPDAMALFTPNWNPAGLSGTYNDHATGIWYDDGMKKISVYNEDIAAMPPEAAFNILIPDENAIAFPHTATSANSEYNYTMLDHPDLNGNPHALVYVTHNWNPGGGTGVYNDQALGVWYKNHTSRWGIFNQDSHSDMPIGAVFNVMIIPNHKTFLPLTMQQCCFRLR